MKKFFAWLLVFITLVISNNNLIMLVRANEEATPSADIEITPTIAPEIIIEATPSATPTIVPDKDLIEINKEYIFDEGKIKIIFKKLMLQEL